MALQSILTKNEIKDLYEVPKLKGDEREFLFSYEADDQKHLDRLSNHTGAKINFIMQQGYFQATGHLYKFDMTDRQLDIDFILSKYFPKVKQIKKVSDYHHYVNRDYLLDKYELTLPTPDVIKQLTTEAKALAKGDVDSRFIMTELLASCLNQQIIRPVYSTIQKMVTSAVKGETNRLSNLLYRYCDKEGFFT